MELDIDGCEDDSCVEQFCKAVAEAVETTVRVCERPCPDCPVKVCLGEPKNEERVRQLCDGTLEYGDNLPDEVTINETSSLFSVCF